MKSKRKREKEKEKCVTCKGAHCIVHCLRLIYVGVGEPTLINNSYKYPVAAVH